MTTAGATGLTRAQVAARAGVDLDYVDRLIACGALPDGVDGELTPPFVRRVAVMKQLEAAGLPMDSVAAGVREGLLSLDFVDSPEYGLFASVSDETFEAASARTGVPVALLSTLREACGMLPPQPTDHLTDVELQILPFLELQVRSGFRPAATERYLLAMADSLRKGAEAEAEWWRTEVLEPRLESATHYTQVAAAEIASAMTQAAERSMLALWHAQEAQTWASNISRSFERILADAGLYHAPERPPAIVFLDITGYTRLTQERGDQAAAELAEVLNRLVKRTSAEHGGRPVKWLGDGVMLWFRDPAPAVRAALAMTQGVVAAGLPPAHVGVHTGPVVIQDGDYYGATVNMAARIAEYARPGEVLVSQDVVDVATAEPGLTFAPIGPVDLKGVSGGVSLHVARRSA